MKEKIQRFYNADAAEFLRRVKLQKEQELELQEMNRTFLEKEELDREYDLALYYDKK
jgi:hypothetical protein